jgi:hypothetical protein
MHREAFIESRRAQGRTTLSWRNFVNSLPWKRVFYSWSLIFAVKLASVSFTRFSQRIRPIYLLKFTVQRFDA